VGRPAHPVAIQRRGVPFEAPRRDVPRAAARGRRRPYDTPISDFGLPLREAAKLRTYGVVAIVSSPFRRCLQTAGVLARALKVDAVTVHDGLGELMHQVRRTSRGFEHCHFCRPSAAQVDDALGPGVAVAASFDVDVAFDESPGGGQRRFMAALDELRAAHASRGGGGLVVVTHGDLVGAAALAVLGEEMVVYDVQECGFLAFRDAFQLADGRLAEGRLAEASRVQVLQEPDGAA